MMVSRRIFLTGSAAVATSMATGAEALTSAALDGAVTVSNLTPRPGVLDNQSRWLQDAINRAAFDKQPLFLPAGTYKVSNLIARDMLHIRGVPGATRLLYDGGGHLLSAENVNEIRLQDIILDGDDQELGDYVSGLLQINKCNRLHMSGVEVRNSSKDAIHLLRTGGRISDCHIENIAETGIFSNEASGLSIKGNDIHSCGDGGIRIWRWSNGEDGTIVTGNRISRIRSRSGGTGQNGNAINVFRANSVMVTNNQISDCDFSAIRGNSASNIQILGNACREMGEVAIYAEFGFEGAIISNNIIDGASTGISITNLDSGGRLGVCSGNLIRNMRFETKSPAFEPMRAVGIAVEADTSISGNVIETAPGCGILLGWGPYLRDITATGNIIRTAGIGIGASVVKGAGTAVITDNVISDAAKGAILGMQWDKIVSGDLTVEENRRYSHLVIERNKVSSTKA